MDSDKVRKHFNSTAKAQIERLELKCYRDKAMLGFGEFLLAKGARK